MKLLFSNTHVTGSACTPKWIKKCEQHRVGSEASTCLIKIMKYSAVEPRYEVLHVPAGILWSPRAI
jgi:hypothetical protein